MAKLLFHHFQHDETAEQTRIRRVEVIKTRICFQIVNALKERNTERLKQLEERMKRLNTIPGPFDY